MLGLLSDMLAEMLVVMPLVLPRQQITDWKKGISRLQGFAHLPLREVGACLMCCFSKHCSTVLFRSASSTGRRPWPQLALAQPCAALRTSARHADVKTVEGSPPSLASTSNTCFVCRQTPANVGRRAGRLIGTARSLVDLRSIYCPWCSFFWAAGLWQTSGQDLWHMLYLASCFGSCEDQGAVSEILPGPHCWACVRRHPLHPLMPLQSCATFRGADPLQPEHCRPHHRWQPTPVVSLACKQHFCSFLQVSPSTNKIDPWKDYVARDWVNQRSLCASALHDLVARTTMRSWLSPIRYQPRMSMFPVQRGWTPWIRQAPYITCHGTKSRIKAYVRKLPVGRRFRRSARCRPLSYRRTAGVLPRVRAWLTAHSCFEWALLADCLLSPSFLAGCLRYSTHHTPQFESYLGPKSQSFASTLFFLGRQLATAWRNSIRGGTEPRVENLCRRFLRSAWQSLSAEKLRHELLSLIHEMLADTRVPASCTCDIPPLHGQYPLGSDSPCQATALVSLLPSGGNAYVGQDGCHPNCSRVQPHPRSHSRNCSWSLRLLLLTTGICRSAANPASTAAPWPPAGVPPPAAPPLTRIAKRAYKRALARAAVPGQGGTFYRGRWQTLRQLQGQILLLCTESC